MKGQDPEQAEALAGYSTPDDEPQEDEPQEIGLHTPPRPEATQDEPKPLQEEFEMLDDEIRVDAESLSELEKSKVGPDAFESRFWSWWRV